MLYIVNLVVGAFLGWGLGKSMKLKTYYVAGLFTAMIILY